MDPKKIEFFRKLLIKQKEDLLKQARQTLSSLTQEGAEIPADLADRASLETNREFLLRIRDRERKLIAKIDQTLKKMEDGTYGICEQCGQEIEEERLKARPVASFCINCKRKLETMEKLRKR